MTTQAKTGHIRPNPTLVSFQKDELVNITEEGKTVTTSLIVAERFGKEHKNVLRDIKNLECSDEFNALNFEPVYYVDAKGEKRPMYLITRDGFTILAMGFTGKKAMIWKEKYINAFNLMEKRLLEQQQKALTEHPGLTPAQQYQVQKAVRAKAKVIAGENNPTQADYMAIYRSIKDRFKVAKYKQIPEECFEELMSFLAEETSSSESGELLTTNPDLEAAAKMLMTKLITIKEAIDHLGQAYGDGMDIIRGIIKIKAIAAKTK